jgi:hypothetical protein
LNWQKWLENWDMTELNISAGFLKMQWKPQDGDRDAAWDLLVSPRFW